MAIFVLFTVIAVAGFVIVVGGLIEHYINNKGGPHDL